ncbi:hypothetical protein ACFXC2_35555, partial [Streptomyces lavendulae]
MTDRLLVCGLGSGMDHSLAALRSPRWELVVVTDRPTDRARGGPGGRRGAVPAPAAGGGGGRWGAR